MNMKQNRTSNTAKEGKNKAIELTDVCVKIPIKSNEVRSIKRALIRSATGGILCKTKQGIEVEALKQINCTIYSGDRVALIGHNGAGKSTFLRVISGIYTVNKGSITRNCKVYPMIQKSFITGPELSGRTAVLANYLLHNQHREGYESQLADIINFSELGDFIDLPLKGYSEGMSARLLFAMLTSQKHECLALDEGFGTGDARFFSKAQDRLKKFIESTGTLILASHSEELLRQFCTRGLVFSNGRIVFDGELNNALDYYHEI